MREWLTDSTHIAQDLYSILFEITAAPEICLLSKSLVNESIHVLAIMLAFGNLNALGKSMGAE